ncbi:MAG: glycosyltransferase, partial [Desulfuromusa sp.]|nr:glycosyltransferase [Desulfuromusa sp.]
MRLAFVLFKYFPYGGLQRDCVKIAQECVQRGHQVDLFALNVSGDVPDGLRLRRISVSARQNYKRYEQFSRKVLQDINQDSYDAVIGF